MWKIQFERSEQLINTTFVAAPFTSLYARKTFIVENVTKRAKPKTAKPKKSENQVSEYKKGENKKGE